MLSFVLSAVELHANAITGLGYILCPYLNNIIPVRLILDGCGCRNLLIFTLE